MDSYETTILEMEPEREVVSRVIVERIKQRGSRRLAVANAPGSGNLCLRQVDAAGHSFASG